MVQRIAKFEKVSYHQFKKSIMDEYITFRNDQIEEMYEKIKLPKRSTAGSAGHDFYAPFNISLTPGESIKIPTGIRCHIEDGWFLGILPRSGQGFKYGVRVANTIGVIDSDYYFSDNEGHIFIKLINPNDQISKKEILRISKSTAFAQGIFMNYGTTYDDDCMEIRNGGFGSTGM